MNSGEGPSFGVAPLRHHHRHTVKRSRGEMEASHDFPRSSPPLFVPQHQNSNAEASHPRTHLVLPRLSPSIRGQHSTAIGRGRASYDFRRPVTTMDQADDVIDLTEEQNPHANDVEEAENAEQNAVSQSHVHRPQRLPRYDREIIDLSADTSPAQQQPPLQRTSPRRQDLSPRHRVHQPHREHGARLRRESSSEVVFVEERPRSASPRNRQRPRAGRVGREPEAEQNNVLDLTADDDEVLHVRTEQRPGGVNLAPPNGIQRLRAAGGHDFGVGDLLRQGATAGLGRLWQRMQDLQGGVFAAAAGARGGEENLFGDNNEDLEMLVAHDAHPHRHRHRVRTAFQPPGRMQYEHLPAGYAPREAHREPTPPYLAPPPPAEGFTRSPKEDEDVVCVACGDVLATGFSDEKRQVWVVKSCGHAYCGYCMNHRKKTQRGANNKGKGRAVDEPTPKTFAHCLVPGCGSKISHPTHVLQIFL